MNRSGLLSSLAGLVAVVWSSSLAGAQGIERGNFDVNIGGGVLLPQNASALQSASPFINMQGRVFVTENFGLGFFLDYSRTETDDDVFPLAQFVFPDSDSTTFVALAQPITLFHYAFLATVGSTVGGRFYPYLSGAIGGYTIYLDPQSAEGATRESDLMFSFGGAVKIGLTGSTAFELSVRDVIYTDYDRETLNTIPDRTCRESGEKQFLGTICPNERLPLLDPERSDPNWPEPKSTIHNIVIAASFSFIPRI